MAGQTTSAGTKEPEGASNAGKLSHAEVKDEADTAKRAPAPDLKGKRVRAIPGDGGTTVVIRKADFRRVGLDHDEVQWDFRRDQFTVAVGDENGQLSQEAATLLTEKYPTQFEYINE